MIIFACYDIGWWNNILPIVQECIKKWINFTAYAGGPSATLFLNNKIPFNDISEVSNISFNDSIKIIFTWTSYPNEHENIIRKIANEHWIITMAILDNWWRYFWRFEFRGSIDITCIPDYYFIMDEYAKMQALKSIHSNHTQLIVSGSPYLENFVKKFKEVKSDTKNILYISDPLKDFWPLDEFENFLDFYELFSKKYEPYWYSLFIKLHPREANRKYDKILRNNNIYNVKYFDRKISNIDALNQAEEIWWAYSMFLMEACLANKKVISYQPINNLKNYEDPFVANKLDFTHKAYNKNDLFRLDLEKKKKIKFKIINNSIQTIFTIINKFI